MALEYRGPKIAIIVLVLVSVFGAIIMSYFLSLYIIYVPQPIAEEQNQEVNEPEPGP